MKCFLVEFSTAPIMFVLEHNKGLESFQLFLLICFCISFHLDSESGGKRGQSSVHEFESFSS